MKTDPDMARRMLVALLHNPDEEPSAVHEMGLTHSELNFLAATCSATTMLWMITNIAQGHHAKALEGLQALELEKVLKDLCQIFRDTKKAVH